MSYDHKFNNISLASTRLIVGLLGQRELDNINVLYVMKTRTEKGIQLKLKYLYDYANKPAKGAIVALGDHARTCLR